MVHIVLTLEVAKYALYKNWFTKNQSLKKLSYNWFTSSNIGKKKVTRNATIVACGVILFS